MRRINVNLHPKSGHKFREADGTLIIGPSWTAVINRVIQYRKVNNKPPGNPTQEVHEQACQQNPNLCVQVSPETNRKRQEVSLKGKVLQWFARVKSVAREFVSLDAATQRSSICVGCPNCVALPDGCASCRAALRELRKEVLGEGRPVDERVIHHGCLVLGFEPGTAVHLNEPTIENAELPAHCWRKRTL